jgi:hypothetical protein
VTRERGLKAPPAVTVQSNYQDDTPGAPTREDPRAPAAEKCLTCWTDGHQPWCWRGQYEWGEALRDAHDLQAAVRWEPKVDLPPLSPPEREQLQLLFDALVVHSQEGAA